MLSAWVPLSEEDLRPENFLVPLLAEKGQRSPTWLTPGAGLNTWLPLWLPLLAIQSTAGKWMAAIRGCGTNLTASFQSSILEPRLLGLTRITRHFLGAGDVQPNTYTVPELMCRPWGALQGGGLSHRQMAML